MNRIYHPWNKWEDFVHNFYGGLDQDKKTKKQDNVLELYASLLRDIPQFENALKIIINEWKYSCEHNLTNESLNRIAYLGQAACALVYRVPHNISCSGYNLLTPEEQKAADAKAQEYLDLWLSRNEAMNVSA